MKTELTEQEEAALTLLRSTGVPVLEAAQVACAALKSGRGRVKRALKCLVVGEETLRKEEKTVSFAAAVREALEDRQGRRVRTIYDFRYFTRRFMIRCPGLGNRRVRAITPQECAQYIEMAFDTPRQRQKARLVLSGVFSTALKRGWCRENPVAQVEVPRVVEKTLPILKPEQIESLRTASEQYGRGICAAAVGMMLYAGVRPHEVARLSWEQVDLQQQAIYILPRHSKTGGARRVTIYKPLLKILERYKQPETASICPPNWLYHWRELRRVAGWEASGQPWPQDVLRHTFASYHLSHFRSYADLQMEIGHRDASLLRTRYLCMKGVQAAADFWDA